MPEAKTVASMTGFARQEGGDDAMTWVWEVKSVNGKGLDVRCRVPNGFEALDQMVRGELGKHCARGNFQVFLAVKRASQRPQLRLNLEALDGILALAEELSDRIATEPPRLDGLLGLPGVIEADEEEADAETRKTREAALLADLRVALAALVAAREGEGAKLAELVGGHLGNLSSLAEEAAGLAAVQPAALKDRFRRQLDELLDGSQNLPEERLAQEVAILATKADVREELDRLAAHLESARDLLAGGGTVGRRLDFLCQELNREANTICSKSADLELTRVGLGLKSTIEQLREQVQNIE